MSSNYAPLDVGSDLDFVRPFLEGEPVGASKVGDGNLNLVFRVWSDRASAIVKQALPYLRIAGDSWSLTGQRARIGPDAIDVHGKLAPGLLPRTIHFEASMSALVFGDLSEHISWGEALIAAQPAEGVAEAVGQYCAAVILGTSDVLSPSRRRKVLRRDFVYSKLCLVTEELIFTAPYLNAPSNRYDPEIDGAAEALRHDRALHSAAAEMCFSFKTRDEALIHVDLHRGSVMTKPGDTRVIGLEFAFFGPCGFHPGMLLANLALTRLAHDAAGNRAFSAVVDQYALEYWDALAEEVKRLWNPSEPWHARFSSQFLRDASRFAGMEIIRRVVGLAHAKDIDSLAQPARAVAQYRAIGGGRALLLGNSVHTFEDVWQGAVGEDDFA